MLTCLKTKCQRKKILHFTNQLYYTFEFNSINSALIIGTIDNSKFCILKEIRERNVKGEINFLILTDKNKQQILNKYASLFKKIGIEGIMTVAKEVKQIPSKIRGKVEDVHLSHSGRITQ